MCLLILGQLQYTTKEFLDPRAGRASLRSSHVSFEGKRSHPQKFTISGLG